MLYAHGSDLCHDLELRHAMANCFEALMGALFLDGGIEVCAKYFKRKILSYNRTSTWVSSCMGCVSTTAPPCQKLDRNFSFV